jgi:hypothetical protein
VLGKIGAIGFLHGSGFSIYRVNALIFKLKPS